MKMDPLKQESATAQSDAVLWFVFLLDPSLLEKHLNEQDSGEIALVHFPL